MTAPKDAKFLEGQARAIEMGHLAAQEARGDLSLWARVSFPVMALIRDVTDFNTDPRKPDAMNAWEMVAAILEALGAMAPEDQVIRLARKVLDEHLAMCPDENGECARRRAFLVGFLEEAIRLD